MTRSLEKITGVTREGLEGYSSDHYDAVPQDDGTYTLVPLRWTNQEEFNEYAFGCGNQGDY